MLNCREEHDILIVHPDVERLDSSVSETFRRGMADFINNGHNKIILNLSRVKFIDSSGLGSIASSFKLMGKNGDLILCSINSHIMAMIKLTRMDRVFQIFPSEERALSSIAK
jgi:anti-sigma B factor antagonist